MQIPMIKSGRIWRMLLLLAAMPALMNCSKIDGSVGLANSAGEPYALEGARVEIFSLNPAAVLPEQSRTLKGIGSVTPNNGALFLWVVAGTIDDDTLYGVEVRCPPDNNDDACTVQSPLHAVLTGAQLKSGDWNITAATEAAFQDVTYYVAVEYSASDILHMLDNYAATLLADDTPEPYAKLLAWKPGSTQAIKRPGQLDKISESLAAGFGAGEIKLLARQWRNPFTGRVDLLPGFEGEGGLRYVVVENGNAYLGGFRVGLRIADVRNPEQPVYLGRIDNDQGFRYGFEVSGDYLYTQDNNYTLFIYDISDPQQSTRLGYLGMPISDFRLLAVYGSYVYIGGDRRLAIADVGAAPAAAFVGHVCFPEQAEAVAVSGDHAYVPLANGYTIAAGADW